MLMHMYVLLSFNLPFLLQGLQQKKVHIEVWGRGQDVLDSCLYLFFAQANV